MSDEDNSVKSGVARTRSRRSLLLMASVAFVPLLLAYVIYFYFPMLIPSSTTNAGELVTPPIAIETFGLRGDAKLPAGKWTLVIHHEGVCDEACEHALYLARQVNVALGKDASRVQRVLLHSGEGLSASFQDHLKIEYPQMMLRDVSLPDTTRRLGELLPDPKLLKGTLFLVDPNGNLMMYYTPAKDGKALLHDLKYLLKLSNIG